MSNNTNLQGLSQTLPNLIISLQSHPSFASQSRVRNGKIYFLHDFVSRTQLMLDGVLNHDAPTDPPAQPGVTAHAPLSNLSDSQRVGLIDDIVGRCMMTQMLINDETGKLGMMTGEKPGEEVDVGEEVRRTSKEVVQSIRG